MRKLNKQKYCSEINPLNGFKLNTLDIYIYYIRSKLDFKSVAKSRNIINRKRAAVKLIS